MAATIAVRSAAAAILFAWTACCSAARAVRSAAAAERSAAIAVRADSADCWTFGVSLLGMPFASYFVRQYLTNLGLGINSFSRPRRKRFASTLNVGAVRPSIGRALANHALRQFVGALGIVHAKRNAVVIAKIKFRQIAMQMLFGAMLIRAFHTALEY
jgi:hypothetical protein